MSRKMMDSGIRWIGEIPESWRVYKMRRIGEFTASGIDKKTNSNEVPVKIINYVDVYRNEKMIIDSSIDFMEVTCPIEKRRNNLVKVGDIIFTPSSETIEEVGISAVVYETVENLAYSYHVLRFTPFSKIELDLSFRKYMCNNHATYNYFSNHAWGTIRKTLNRDDFKDAPVVVPSIIEQKKIATFLDNKLSHIDTIIKKTKLTIEEYKILKQSTIIDAVTKGLKKNVEMMDSGVDWIGVMPSHWRLSKLKYEFSIKKDIAGKEGFNVLSVTQKGLKIKNININEGQMAADYSKYQIVNKGDYVMNHMDLLTGWVDYSIYDGVTSPDYRVFFMRTPEEHSTEYFKYIFQSSYKNRVFYGMGQGVSNLGRWRLQADKFLNFYLPIPPKSEQYEITDYIVYAHEKYNDLITNKETLLIELEQYKKSLIYEYATGKKEVI